GRQLIDLFALWPPGSGAAPGFQIWQPVTYSFLHGGVFHLLINMYALWLFGSRMEMVWGSKAFLIYYFLQGEEMVREDIQGQMPYPGLYTVHVLP
ncbi:MAG: rhomboid family intramembrane serine protease, partial [Pseudomonadota bacterium]